MNRLNVALGVEAAFDRWGPSSEPEVIGVDWHASGAAYLLEVTPVVRITTAQSIRDPRQFIVQMGAGATFISSNAEVMEGVPGYPAEWVGFDLDSQVAPSLIAGLGWRSLSGEALGTVDLRFHALFTEPKATNYLTLSLGVAFW